MTLASGNNRSNSKKYSYAVYQDAIADVGEPLYISNSNQCFRG